MDTMSKPLTLHGHAYLADEHEWLSKNERPRVLNMISAAAAEGDRSEMRNIFMVRNDCERLIGG